MANFECTSREMALSVLETIANGLGGLNKPALLAAREGVSQNTFKIPEDYGERRRLAAKIEGELLRGRRDSMTAEERIEEARFFLDGLSYVLEVK